MADNPSMADHLRFRISVEDHKYLHGLGFGGFSGYSLMREMPDRSRRYIQIRNGGWRALNLGRCEGLVSWVSDPFPDAVSCYLNAELCQWQS